jgi:hypothetical protein
MQGIMRAIQPKRAALFLAFLLGISSSLTADTGNLKIGLGLGTNLNAATASFFNLERSITLEFQLLRYVINGVQLRISEDFTLFTSIETDLFARWYFLDKTFKYKGWFTQADMGLALRFTLDTTNPSVSLGLNLGYRLPLRDGDYYTEPYIRVGYPTAVSFGARLGCRFW